MQSCTSHPVTNWLSDCLSDWLTELLSQKVENICQYRCQDSEIYHEASLGTLIMIQEEPIWRTMWGPCFGHERAIFWPFLEEGDYEIHPEFWNLAWSIPGHINYDSGRTNLKDHVRTMFWPWKGHILACNILGRIDCDSDRTDLKDHVRTIFGP